MRIGLSLGHSLPFPQLLDLVRRADRLRLGLGTSGAQMVRSWHGTDFNRIADRLGAWRSAGVDVASLKTEDLGLIQRLADLNCPRSLTIGSATVPLNRSFVGRVFNDDECNEVGPERSANSPTR
jgi:hypothetical protein